MLEELTLKELCRVRDSFSMLVSCGLPYKWQLQESEDTIEERVNRLNNHKERGK